MSHRGFFERQASARRNTLWLVALFLAAVVAITLSVCLLGYAVTRSESTGLSFPDWLLSEHGLITAMTVSGLIFAGSLVRWVALAGGGEKVAKMVGAREIDPATRDADEKKLRNIVEEMAIASGVTVPQLYVMDHETGINAFVAGYSPGQAVMVVTKGALAELTRDELQGVVAHEFSHILNGDMRLNVRLIALLAGVLMIGQVGTFLLHSGTYTSRRRNKEQGAVVILGIALIAIGYIGVFFGRLIQAAVSRQREMLADASSVQFTRNPDGIASALYKIGITGGHLNTTSHASDMNHMCFDESTPMRLSRLLASHPPIEVRINAIQPGMLIRLKNRRRDTAVTRNSLNREAGVVKSSPANPATSSFAGGVALKQPAPRELADIDYTPTQFSGSVGTVTAQSEAYAINLLGQLPDNYRELLYTRVGAVQLCYALLTYEVSEEVRTERLTLIGAHPLFKPQEDLLNKLIPTLQKLGATARFPSLELAMPALRRLDPEEKKTLLSHIHTLVLADGRLSLFEFALFSFLQRHLAADAGSVPRVSYRRFAQVQTSLEQLLSLMARAGTSSVNEARGLFVEAMAGFNNPQQEPTFQERVTVQDLRRALGQLNQLSSLLKPAIIDACGHCAMYDGKISVTEYDIVRLVADQLDCPMPPLAV